MKPRVKLDRRGVRDMLRSAPVQRELNQRAESMAASAGPGYEAGPHQWTTRGRASVITATPEAMRDNAKRNTLVRVLASRNRGA